MTTTRPMTKSPRDVAREALRLAQEALPAYSSKFSRRDYTQHQLLAVLALKTFRKTDYRGVAAALADFADLCQDLGLSKVPDHSTLCYESRQPRAIRRPRSTTGPGCGSSRYASASNRCQAQQSVLFDRIRPDLPPNFSFFIPD